jgi:hypothetical protein
LKAGLDAMKESSEKKLPIGEYYFNVKNAIEKARACSTQNGQ